MLLTQAELQSLVEVKQRTPHQFLGMHPLADGTGVVARALVPNAAKVSVEPVREKDGPAFGLTRLHKAGVFEGVTTEAKGVYAYELVITDQEGRVRRTRDAYSFLPTLGDADCICSARGTSGGFTRSWGRSCGGWTGWPGRALRSGRPTPSG